MAIKKEQGVSITKPNFDITFQMGILKMALQDDYFCTQLVKYLANDNDLDDYNIFDNKKLQVIFKIIADSMISYKTRPTEGQVRQKFTEYSDTEILNEILNKILETEVHNDAFYREHMKTYITQVKMSKGFFKTQKIWLTHPDSSHEFMQQVIDDIRRVSFDREDTVGFNDLERFISDNELALARKLPSGLKKLDEDLGGGLPRQSLAVVLAGSNVGKSMYCCSVGANILRACDKDGKNYGYKILHINLEGMREEALLRYTSNLAQVNHRMLTQGKMNEQEKKRVEIVQKMYGDRLLIRNMLGFGATIEDLVSYCREIHKDYKFDLLIVDYGQLLDTKQKTDGLRHVMSKVFRGLDSIGKELDCVVLTPAQATRNSQEKQTDFTKRKAEDKAPVLRMTDISEAMEIARVAAVIFTLNATEEELASHKMRLFLEKQRQGAKNITYGLITNFSQCNLLTGKYYDPKSAVIEGELLDNDGGDSNVATLGDLKLPQQKNNVSNSLSEQLKRNIENQDTTSQDLIFENEMQKFVHEQLLMFEQCKMEYLNIKQEFQIEQETNQDDFEALDTMVQRMNKLKEAMQDHINEAKMVKYQAYPNITVSDELINTTKKSLTDLKKSKGDPKEIHKIEVFIKHLEFMSGIIKIPS